MADVTSDPEAWARLGTKIRERRESMGLSRRQLSEVAGVSEKSIQVAEEGRTPRARWPQSLRLIEHALRWEPGSMVEILDGGEPALMYDLFSLAEEMDVPHPIGQDSPLPVSGDQRLEQLAHSRGEEFPTNHTRSVALAALPPGLRKSLTEVLNFGRKAVGYGADPELAERYEEAVEDLLMDLIGRPLGHPSATSDPGHLAMWLTAMRMDPVLRKEREEQQRQADRYKRTVEAVRREAGLPTVPRTHVVGDVGSVDLINELRRLSKEVERLAAKVDNE